MKAARAFRWAGTPVVAVLCLAVVACDPWSTEVTTSSATLGAWGTPTTSSMDWFFRYGTDPGLVGATSTSTQTKSGLTPGVRTAATTDISGLTPGTRYYYALCGKPTGSSSAATCEDTASLRTRPADPSVAPPLPSVKTIGDDGELGEAPFVVGHDRGQSTLYDDGSTRVSYWSFGDTKTRVGSTERLRHNTAGFTSDLNMDDNLSPASWTYDKMLSNGHPDNAVPLPAQYEALNTPSCTTCWKTWGGAVVADPDNQRLIMIYHVIGRIVRNGVLDAGYSDIGYGIALRNMSTPTTSTWVPKEIHNPDDTAHPYLLWANPNPQWTTTTPFAQYSTGTMTEDGYLYAYSCQGSTTSPCSAGRVDLDDVRDRDAWRFWNEADTSCPTQSWVADISCTAPMTSEDPSGEVPGGAGGMSVSFNPHLGAYVQVYAPPWLPFAEPQPDLTRARDEIRYRVAYRPQGPWSESGLLARGRATTDGVALYAAYMHPEFQEQNGAVSYVTYYRSSGTDPEFRLLRVVFDGAEDAAYRRAASAEAYYAQDTVGGTETVKINALGPTTYDSTSYQQVATTAVRDQQGRLYVEGGGQIGTSVVARLDSLTTTATSGTTNALAGLTVRNTLNGSAHWHGNGIPGRGYVVLGKRGSTAGGIVIRSDTDGDHDLDAGTGNANPISVNYPVWLKLTRTTQTTYTGYYSTNSTDGTDGTWNTVGSVTVPSATVTQDAGLFAAGFDDGSTRHFAKGTISHFQTGL